MRMTDSNNISRPSESAGAVHGLTFSFNDAATRSDAVDKDLLYGRYQKQEDARLADNQTLKMKMAYKALDIPQDDDVNINAKREDNSTNHYYPPPPVDVGSIVSAVTAAMPKQEAPDIAGIISAVTAAMPKPVAQAVDTATSVTKTSTGIGMKHLLWGMLGSAVVSAIPGAGIGLLAWNMMNKAFDKPPATAAQDASSKTVIEKTEKVQIKFYNDQGEEIHVDRLPPGLKDRTNGGTNKPTEDGHDQ